MRRGSNHGFQGIPSGIPGVLGRLLGVSDGVLSRIKVVYIEIVVGCVQFFI